MSTTFCGDLIIEKNIIKCISSGYKQLCFVFVGDDLDSDKEITKQSLVYYIINNSKELKKIKKNLNLDLVREN